MLSSCKSVVHWDGKMLPDVTGKDHGNVHRFPVLISSIVDGSTKLLEVPKGSGRSAADVDIEQLKSLKCDTLIVGMCFDTTASKTEPAFLSKMVLEATYYGWHVDITCLTCCCPMHLVCQPSTRPDTLFFKRFRDKWSELTHHVILLENV